MNFETCIEIETVIAHYFNPRRNIIVPNVWWGLGLNHECDLFIVTKGNYAYEVEIKISKSDLIADGFKLHLHGSNKIRKLYFAIPRKMENCLDLIPDKAGVFIIDHSGYLTKSREAKINTLARPLTSEERLKVAELGTMRIWRLKKNIIDLIKDSNPICSRSAI